MRQHGGITLFEALAFAAVQVALVAAAWRGAPEAREIAGVHNHEIGSGQNVFYNDGHIKWSNSSTVATSASGGGWDPTKKHSADATCAIIADRPETDTRTDTYVGASGYDTSLTDICIVR